MVLCNLGYCLPSDLFKKKEERTERGVEGREGSRNTMEGGDREEVKQRRGEKRKGENEQVLLIFPPSLYILQASK